MDYVVEMQDIVKRFGSSCANDHITLKIQRGEIISLLGENGAGKTTLMNVLFGLYQRDSGTITLNGEAMPTVYSPQIAIQHGIAMVHQHLKLIETFTVAQNVVLGAEHTLGKLLFRNKACEKKVAALCEKYHMNIDPRAVISTLPLGMKQRVEILKALYRECKILILDEPTTVLTPQESHELFAMLREFKEAGMTIIIITHKLNEVMAISDRVVVLRQGKLISTFQTSQTNPAQLAATMVGKTLAKVQVEACQQVQEQLYVELSGVTTAVEGDACNLKGVDLKLYKGCIVGVAGVDGNGQTELVEVLSGVRRMEHGHIRIGDAHIARNTAGTMRREGLGIIPEDRHKQGLVLPFSVYENIMLGYRHDPRFVKGGILRKKKGMDLSNELADTFDIRPRDIDVTVNRMSGGNQQKVVIARELSNPELSVVVASQPTRGLDAGAIQSVHNTLISLRKEGKAVLLISSDLEEIRSLSDEIAVLYDGRIVVQLPAGRLSDEEIGLYMGGSGRKDQ